jgi:hypothetical protein
MEVGSWKMEDGRWKMEDCSWELGVFGLFYDIKPDRFQKSVRFTKL